MLCRLACTAGKPPQKVIDKAHKRVYGEERLARTERLKPLEDESGEPDWDAFDSPTFERKGGAL